MSKSIIPEEYHKTLQQVEIKTENETERLRRKLDELIESLMHSIDNHVSKKDPNGVS